MDQAWSTHGPRCITDSSSRFKLMLMSEGTVVLVLNNTWKVGATRSCIVLKANGVVIIKQGYILICIFHGSNIGNEARQNRSRVTMVLVHML